MNKKLEFVLYLVLVSLVLLFGYALISSAHAALEKPFFKDHARGWFWYEDPEPEFMEEEKKEEEKKEYALTVDVKPKPKTATARLKDVQDTLREVKATAILEPTQANVKAYQELQLQMVNQSEAFSKAWMMNVYTHPSLDENVKNPTAATARFVVYENEKKETATIIKDLKSTYGLFYFFQGNCSYCKAFAPLLKQFAEKYGWEVMAISLDGAPSDVFPNWQPDNGISKQWNVATVPAVFAVNPETNHVIPVANGFTSIDQMETRIVAIVKGAPGQ